jgi:CDP-diacylglycerol--serine O-phosphatidyltransferase
MSGFESEDKYHGSQASRIYVLPNLMTAGNLLCGFLAIIWCIQAKFYQTIGASENLSAERLSEMITRQYKEAVLLILAAVIFDILDGRLARFGGRESLFGKEFDSLADLVSFGLAPALMVLFLIISPDVGLGSISDLGALVRNAGVLIGALYLLCAAVRLARFNVLTHPLVYSQQDLLKTRDFIGLPVPAAAGAIASIVLLLNRYDLRAGAAFLPILMILISLLMVSSVRYPSFKKVDWQTRTQVRTFILVAVFLVLLFLYWEIAIVLLFLSYVFFGLARFVCTWWKGRKNKTVTDNQ